MTQPQEAVEFEADNEKHDRFRIGVREVIGGGRIKIPNEDLDEHDVRKGDVVDCMIKTHRVTFWVLDAVVQKHGRVSIPDRKRRLYGVKIGEPVDVEIRQTGLVDPTTTEGGE